MRRGPTESIAAGKDPDSEHFTAMGSGPADLSTAVRGGMLASTVAKKVLEALSSQIDGEIGTSVRLV